MLIVPSGCASNELQRRLLIIVPQTFADHANYPGLMGICRAFRCRGLFGALEKAEFERALWS